MLFCQSGRMVFHYSSRGNRQILNWAHDVNNGPGSVQVSYVYNEFQFQQGYHAFSICLDLKRTLPYKCPCGVGFYFYIGIIKIKNAKKIFNKRLSFLVIKEFRIYNLTLICGQVLLSLVNHSHNLFKNSYYILNVEHIS